MFIHLSPEFGTIPLLVDAVSRDSISPDPKNKFSATAHYREQFQSCSQPIIV
jgi:hypothetical protein